MEVRVDRQVAYPQYAAPIFAPVFHLHLHTNVAPESLQRTQSLHPSALTSGSFLPRWSCASAGRLVREGELRTRCELEMSERWRRIPHPAGVSCASPRLLRAPSPSPPVAYLRLSMFRRAGIGLVRDGRIVHLGNAEVDRARTLHHSTQLLIRRAYKQATERWPTRRPHKPWLRRERLFVFGRQSITRFFEKSVAHSVCLERERLGSERLRSSTIVVNERIHRVKTGVALVFRDRTTLERHVAPVQLVLRSEVPLKQRSVSVEKPVGPVKAPAPPQIDVGRLSQEVIRTIDRSLRIERERRGRL